MQRYLAVLLLGLLSCAPSGTVPDIEVTGTSMFCRNATTTSNFQQGSYAAYTCTWYCASYMGQDRRYVQLTYVWTGSAWVLDSTFTDAGICGSYDRTPTAV